LLQVVFVSKAKGVSIFRQPLDVPAYAPSKNIATAVKKPIPKGE
jgi:hypothetical protein